MTAGEPDVIVVIVLKLVRYHQQRNYQAYQSHRKRRLKNSKNEKLSNCRCSVRTKEGPKLLKTSITTLAD